MKETVFKSPPKHDTVHMTKKRALKDPVLREVLKYADNELALHMRVNLAPMIKRLDLGQHREFIKKHFKGVLRDILEETFGPLIAITHTGELAGVGKGTWTTGYRRTVQAYQDLADAELARKQGIAIGLGGGHGVMADLIEDATGNARPILRVEVEHVQIAELPAPLEKPLQVTDGAKLQMARKFIGDLMGRGPSNSHA